MTADQNINQLPNGWEWKQFSEVAKLIRGVSYDKQNAFNDPAEGLLPILRATNIQNGLVLEEFVYVPEKIVKEEQLIKEGDIILAMSSGSKELVGKAAQAKQDYEIAFGTFCGLIRPNEKINKKFFGYYFQTREYRNYVSSISKGIGINNLRRNHIEDLSFPLCSPEEQIGIVSKIEELFSELDKGIEELKTAQQQLKVYRQAVLKWAFESDLENKEKMFLSDVTEKIQIGPFGTQLHKEDYVEGGIPLINPMHIQNGMIVPNLSYSIKEDKRDSLPNYILEQDDVIMGRRGEMGRCGLVTEKEHGWFCGTGSLYARPNKKFVNSKFLYHLLQSETTKKYLEENAGGTTMANLNLKIVRNIPLHLPTVEEQQQIVQEIESRLSVCDKIEETITNSLKQSEALRQSILKKAFEGRLVKKK